MMYRGLNQYLYHFGGVPFKVSIRDTIRAIRRILYKGLNNYLYFFGDSLL